MRSKGLIGKYYDRILLVVDIPNGNDRFAAEQAFQQEFTARGLTLMTASTLFPNLRSLSESEVNAVLAKNDVQAVLTITPSAAADVYAGIQRPKLFTAPKLAWANTLLYYDNPKPVYPEHASLYTGEECEFSLKLFDTQTGKLAWLGVSKTEKDGLGSFSSLIEDNARETVKKLGMEKLIVPAIAADH